MITIGTVTSYSFTVHISTYKPRLISVSTICRIGTTLPINVRIKYVVACASTNIYPRLDAHIDYSKGLVSIKQGLSQHHGTIGFLLS